MSCAGDYDNIPPVNSTLLKSLQFFYAFIPFNCEFLNMAKVCIVPTLIGAHKWFPSNQLYLNLFSIKKKTQSVTTCNRVGACKSMHLEAGGGSRILLNSTQPNQVFFSYVPILK